jgi:hypothetical protein
MNGQWHNVGLLRLLRSTAGFERIFHRSQVEDFCVIPPELHSDLLLAMGGHHGPLFPSQRSHGKKLVPAGCAAERREPEDPPGNRSHTRHVLGRNALQFQVAANPAMSVEEGAQWQEASVKS